MSSGLPDFSTWSIDRLIGQRKHLESLLAVSVGQSDPVCPQLRAERDAVRTELTRRMTCPACLGSNHEQCEDPCKCPCPGREQCDLCGERHNPALIKCLLVGKEWCSVCVDCREVIGHG